jgi:hypothetical protein
MTDSAGNAQTTLVGSPQSVTVTRNGEPDAPVISSVTAGNAQVVVSWSAPANNGAAISDYRVQYSTSSSGSYTTFADGTSTSTSATVTGLANSTAYYFKVAATNSVGTGSNSAASAAATPTLPTQIVTWSPTTALTTAQSPNTPLAASSSGDGAITYGVQSAGTTGCTIDALTGVLFFTTAGNCMVRATAATTSNYLTGHIDATFTITTATCAMGGACIVGNTGPGGGTVFYVHASGTFACGATLASTCKYLEAAPTSGTSAWTDASYAWSGNTTGENLNARGTAVGSGYKNTAAMVAQNSTANRAGTIARAYRGPNNLSDWYLPSKDELNQLYIKRATVGGFVSNDYWSSSEAYSLETQYQNFSVGTQSNLAKYYTLYVRPVRAFG